MRVRPRIPIRRVGYWPWLRFWTGRAVGLRTGPDPVKDGVVRWRCVDLKRVIKERFGVDLEENSVGPAF